MATSQRLYDRIQDTAKVARTLFVSYVVLLLYATVTVAATTDRQIVLNEGAQLPGLQLEVPLQGFLFAAPALLSSLYVYLLLYIHRLRRLTGRALEQGQLDNSELYPWMLTLLEDPHPGRWGRFERGVAIASIWWFLPACLAVFAVAFARVERSMLAYVATAWPLLGVWIALASWCKYRSTKVSTVLKGRAALATIMLVLIVEGALVVWLIPGTMRGTALRLDLSYQSFSVVDSLGARRYAGFLRGARLQGANLRGAMLKQIDLRNAFLVRSELEEANLSRSDLRGSDLRGASLRGAQARGAQFTGVNAVNAVFDSIDLRGAQLGKAVFNRSSFVFALLDSASADSAKFQNARMISVSMIGAQLRGADFGGAALDRANFSGAVLSGARFSPGQTSLKEARLIGADLQRADLTGARLHDASLDDAQLRSAVLVDAVLTGAQLRRADLRNANLRRANLTAAKLQRAKLAGAILRQARLVLADLRGAQLYDSVSAFNASEEAYADVSGAEFDGAVLDNADLRRVRGLTADQVCSARSARNVRLDPTLRKEVEASCRTILGFQ